MNMNYQKTLNLPQTDFSMRAGLAQREPLLLKQWEDLGLYNQIRQQAAGRPPYTLHDGPPYANGNIHTGHALNKILKDMIVKIKTMQGFDTLYVPGWDCHGLPIEHQLFKKLKKRKSDVDTVEFRRQAHDYAMEFVAVQRDQFKRLGIFGQWDRPYLTLDPEYEYWILMTFARLVAQGYVYRGLKPVNWCANCETALAEAEVEYEDHTSPSVYVKFRVQNPQARPGLPAGKPVSLVVWTTTPWTLLANVAVAAHPQYAYVAVDVGDEILVMEKSLHAGVLARAGIAKFSIRQELPGSALTALTYRHPFDMKESCPVINVDYVTREDGTGLVHTAPGHGQEDYEAGVANGLDILMPVNDRGVFTEAAGAFAGQHVFKANEPIIAALRESGQLLAAEDIAHSYPHCWRCKKPIIFRATKQWFLSIDHHDLRRKLKEAIQGQVAWIPAAGQERITSMVATRPDWCLSRQRHWGVPIPALACAGCGGEHRLYGQVIEHFAGIVRARGTDAWFADDLTALLPKGFACPDCGGTAFEKTADILDVWFDSGVSHQAVVKAMMGRELPADLYLEGSDQHRGWFQSSLIPAVALEGRAPFRSVLTHGFVVDGNGRKMSKSLGNVISPEDVVKDHGVDILRLWVAASNYHDDIRLSKEILDRQVDAYRKIRNTLRFLLGNLSGFDPAKDLLAYEQLLPVDQYALFLLAERVAETRQAFNDFEFFRAYKLLYTFCNEDLSGFYLDILKDRLYTSGTSAPERRSAQTVLYHILEHLVRLLAPVLTFTAEEAFAAMPKGSDTQTIASVHLLTWEAIPAVWNSRTIADRFALFMELRPLVLRALEDKRRDGEIGSSLEARVVLRTASPRDGEYLRGLAAMLPALLIVSQVEIQSVTAVAQGAGGSFGQTQIVVEKAVGEKCARCWNFSPEVGQAQDHPQLCGRCAAVVRRTGVDESAPA